MTCLEHIYFDDCMLTDGTAALVAMGLTFLGPRLQTLSLANNALQGEGVSLICDVLIHASSLCSLDLSFNRPDSRGLERLVHLLSGRMKLRDLRLAGICSTSEDMNRLLEGLTLASCRHLDLLDLSTQMILDAEGQDKLRRVLLNACSLTFLVLSGMELNCTALEVVAPVLPQTLRHLDLSSNTVSTKGGRLLAAHLPPRLHTLDLSWNPMGDEFLQDWSQRIPPTLRVLHMDGTLLTDHGVVHLAGRPITELTLANNQVTEEGAIVLAGGALMDHLQVLDLSYNHIAVSGITALASRAPHLQRFDVGKNLLTGEGSDAIAAALPHHLQRLGLSSSGIDDASLMPLFRHRQHLLRVDLSDNHITVMGAMILGDVLPSTLQTLDLSHNPLSSSSATSLARAFKRLTRLQHLRLSGCHLRSHGIECLSEAWRECKMLRHLVLDGNRIGDSGARALADALYSMRRLETLSLGKNRIGPEGCASIAESVSWSLEVLLLSQNVIGDRGVHAIALHMQGHDALRVVDLDGNRCGDRTAKILADHLHHWPRLERLTLRNNPLDPLGAGLYHLRSLRATRPVPLSLRI